jgi:hypothetical protein
MNDHDFNEGGWISQSIDPNNLYRLINDLNRTPDAMHWSARWQDRTGDAAPMRSHP